MEIFRPIEPIEEPYDHVQELDCTTARSMIVNKIVEDLYDVLMAFQRYPYSVYLDQANRSKIQIKDHIRDLFIPFFDRLQILERMTKSAINAAMQPHYKAADHKPIVEAAKSLGILVERKKMIYTERGRYQEVRWVEPGIDYRYNFVKSLVDLTREKEKEKKKREGDF